MQAMPGRRGRLAGERASITLSLTILCAFCDSLRADDAMPPQNSLTKSVYLYPMIPPPCLKIIPAAFRSLEDVPQPGQAPALPPLPEYLPPVAKPPLKETVFPQTAVDAPL